MKKIVLIEPRYPYGKDKVYLGGSLVSAGARLSAMGHAIQMIDFNIDRISHSDVQKKLGDADIIGIGVIGAPHIPGVLKLVPQIRAFAPDAVPILIGGQVIERITTSQFNRVFRGFENIVQVKGNHDLVAALGCVVFDLPSPQHVSYIPVWEQMEEQRLAQYLEHESALVVSQGCHHKCDFCAASKRMRESFRLLERFVNDLRYQVRVAERAGLKRLEFYASSLDFFQNPRIVARYLEALVQTQVESGIEIKVRCLSCMDSFLSASKEIPNFGDLLQQAGLWCIGFGIDGDEEVWRDQKKRQNKQDDILPCLELTRDLGITAELLMVMGFPTQDQLKLSELVENSFRAVEDWPNVVLRPYLAKGVVPGNKGWETNPATVATIVNDSKKFYNLDFCALGSSLTHPDPEHRRLSNKAFLAICDTLVPSGKCATSPLLPQGEDGEDGIKAAEFNRLQPFDR